MANRAKRQIINVTAFFSDQVTLVLFLPFVLLITENIPRLALKRLTSFQLASGDDKYFRPG